jgi:hypothetical protein
MLAVLTPCLYPYIYSYSNSSTVLLSPRTPFPNTLRLHATMDSLPDETLLTIASFIDPDNWRSTQFANFRLVSRRYARIGAQVMFESFQFHPTTFALERMRGVVATGLDRWITCLDYDGDTVDRNGNHSALQTTVFGDIVLGLARAESNFTWVAAWNLHAAVFSVVDLAPACSNITMLDLHFSGFTLTPEFLPRVKEFTQSLVQLEMLTLSFGFLDYERDHDPPRLDTHAWPKLRCMVLEYVVARESEMVALLQNHAATLRCFHFKGVKLEHGDWRRVFTQVARIEHLKHGSLSCLNNLRIFDDEVAWIVEMEGQKRKVEIMTNLARWLK